MNQITVFHKGIITDLDYSKMDNQGLLLPTSNIRILNVDGKGLIITPSKGNKKAFELSLGFSFLGACEYNGIVYIASVNTLTGEGEMGSFPSPASNGGFEEVYKPLLCLSNDFHVPMRSQSFKFDLENPIGDEMLAEIDYDGTVSIIFTDFKNDLRLVNSGFNQQGSYKPERYFQITNLERSIKAIKDIPEQQKISFIKQEVGGRLKYGNYIAFYRYVDASNNRTEFVGESAPFTVNRRSPLNPSLIVGAGNEESNKKVSFEIKNIDNSFAYVEVAMMRFYSSDNLNVIPEIFIVDQFYHTTNETLTIHVTGFETQIPITISEILKPVNNETVCQSIISHDRRIWGANWKGKEINYEALKEYGLKIKIGVDDSKVIPHWALRSFYSDPENIKFAGYFRNEAYITGVVFVLNNGYETERFPVRGIDARLISPSEVENAYNTMNVNNQGVIIMPDSKRSPALFNSTEMLPNGTMQSKLNARILALKFIITEANDWTNSAQGGDNAKWIKENVREIRFVRAERVPNIIYQGLAAEVYGRKVSYLSAGNWIYNGASFPLFRHAKTPGMWFWDPYPGLLYSTYLSKRTSGVAWEYRMESDEQEQRMRAVFSTDFVFGVKDIISDGQQMHAKRNYVIRYNDIDKNGMRMSDPFVFINDPINLNVKNTNIVYDENNWIKPTNKKSLGLVNRTDNNKDFPEDYLIKRDDNSNIGMISPGYIGIEFNESANYVTSSLLRNNDLNYNIISLFRFNPNSFDYLTLYQSELNLNYFSISRSVLFGTNNCLVYQGDCFIQRTTMKVRTWAPTRLTDTNGREIGADINMIIGDSNDGPVRYAHGQVVDIVTENTINTALRYSNYGETTTIEEYQDIDVGWNLWQMWWSIFPYSTKPTYAIGAENVVKLTTGIESFLVNASNSKTVSIKPYLSFNPKIPKGENKFLGRIRYSGKQEPNYPPLAFRMWNYASKEDFSLGHGEIKKIIIVFNKLISIHETSIMTHSLNREEVVPTSSGQMVIGIRAVLSKEPVFIARFGSQHKYAVVKAKSGVYGWDWMNNVMWRIAMNEKGNIIAQSIDKENMIEKYLVDLKIKTYGNNQVSSNISRKLKDRFFHQNQEGIMLGYDKKQGEILFSFASANKNEIMRFDENINAFIGNYEFRPVFFVNLQSDTFGFSMNQRSFAYLMGAGNYSEFFGITYKPKFSFVVNGFIGEEQNYVHFDKVFKSLAIEGPMGKYIEKVEYETLYQKGANDPLFSDEFWREPEYLLSKYSFPINTANHAEGQYKIGSHLEGKWVKITVTLKDDPALLDNVFIKNILTNFIISNS